MEIYVVQQGDTIDSIALKFGISADKLIMDNGINAPANLVIGQTLVIAHPEQVYIVKEGDTLGGIAEEFQVTVMQLLRNNPFLADRQFIYPGETLVISYDNSKGTVFAVGYTYPFIRDDTLKRTLPNLAYLLIFNYIITASGEVKGSDEDSEIIMTASLYDTGSTLVVTSFSQIGEANIEVEDVILKDPGLQDKLIDNLLEIIKTKGYNGVNLAYQFINAANQQLYLDFLIRVSNRLHSNGYSVFLTINPGLKYDGTEVTFEKINYSEFSNLSDGILFLSYDWGSIESPPMPISIITTEPLLDYIVEQVPLDKIRIVMPTLGYDWELPYQSGRTKANALIYDSVLMLANQMNAVILYDEKTLSAFFEYYDINNNLHIVWFKDARSIDASLKVLQSYGIEGIGIWNIMYYFAQMWLVINTQYEIVK